MTLILSFYLTQQTQDVNWTYIRHSEDVLDVFWTSYVRSIYGLCLLGRMEVKYDQPRFSWTISAISLKLCRLSHQNSIELLSKKNLKIDKHFFADVIICLTGFSQLFYLVLPLFSTGLIKLLTERRYTSEISQN